MPQQKLNEILTVTALPPLDFPKVQGPVGASYTHFYIFCKSFATGATKQLLFYLR